MPSRLRSFALVVIGCLLSATVARAAVEEGALQPDRPQSYRVQPGDTLWGIAGRFLREPWRWPELMEANPGIGRPERLQAGDRIRLVSGGGRTHAKVERHGGIPVVKLSPRVREIPLDGGIPAIPLSVIGHFLTRPYVGDSGLQERAPYVVHFVSEHITGGLGDEIYARGDLDPNIGDYQIVRLGKAYEDPDSGDILGYEASFIGVARVERPGEIAKLRITEMALETLVGDRLVPLEPLEPLELADFFPRPAPPGTGGRIVGVLRGVYEIGVYDLVVISRGRSDGVLPGAVYKIFQGGNKVSDPIAREQWWLDQPAPYQDWPSVSWPETQIRLPLEETGILMVFRSFERLSFALVMSATGPIHLYDRIRPPQS